MMARPRKLPLIALLSFLALALTGARAHANDDDEAKRRYERGMAHYNLDEWDQAIAEWTEGYRVRPVPEFLFNIAQAYRLSGRAEKALAFYRKYLHNADKTAERADAERQVEALKRVIEEQQKAASAPPRDAVQPGLPGAGATVAAKPAPTATSVAATPPAPTGQPRQTAEASPPAGASRPANAVDLATAGHATPGKPVPAHRKWWVWTAVGTAVIGVGLGVGLGLGLSTKSPPGSDFGTRGVF
jgi:tetratricopeptide (TPR) repeat protein